MSAVNSGGYEYHLERDAFSWGGFPLGDTDREYANDVPGVISEKILHEADMNGPWRDGWNHDCQIIAHGGALYAVWNMGVDSANELPGTTAIAIRTSFDLGESWGPLKIAIPGICPVTDLKPRWALQMAAHAVNGRDIYVLCNVKRHEEKGVADYIGILSAGITNGDPAEPFWVYWKGKLEGRPKPSAWDKNLPSYDTHPELSQLFEERILNDEIQMFAPTLCDPRLNGTWLYPPQDECAPRDFFEIGKVRVNSRKYFRYLRRVGWLSEKNIMLYAQFNTRHDGWNAITPQPTPVPNGATRLHIIPFGDGRYVMSGNHRTEPQRKHLWIAVSRQNALDFPAGNIFALKREADEPRPLKYGGQYKAGIWQYPYMASYGGALHLVYTLHKEDVYYMKIDCGELSRAVE